MFECFSGLPLRRQEIIPLQRELFVRQQLHHERLTLPRHQLPLQIANTATILQAIFSITLLLVQTSRG